LSGKRKRKKLSKVLRARPGFAELAAMVAEFERLDDAVEKARLSSPYRAYVGNLAKSGNAAARQQAERFDGPSDAQARAYATRVLKSSTSAEVRHLAQTELDRLNGRMS
jgi:hypothetical protein